MIDSAGSTPEQPMHPEVAEARDATLPARPESKKELLDLIDLKLKGKTPTKFDPHQTGGDFIVEETNTPVSFFRWDTQANNPSGILAMVHVIEWANGKTGGPKLITNYHFREAPDELSVEKMKQFNENKSEKPGKTREELLQSAIDGLNGVKASIKALEVEREAGLTVFTQQDATDLKDLITKAAPRKSPFDK